MNAAFTQAARNVLFHDEALLQRFRLTVKASPKPQKSKFTVNGKKTHKTMNRPEI